MPLGMEAGLGPGDIVLDGDPTPPKKKAQPPFLAHVYCGQTVAHQQLLLSSCYAADERNVTDRVAVA